MESEFVFRVQRKDGSGPYNDSFGLRDFPWVWDGFQIPRWGFKHGHCRCECHPGPRLDRLSVQAGEQFGFPTVSLALEWFVGWERELAQEGFFVFKCAAKPGSVQLGLSGKQVVFQLGGLPVIEVDFKDVANEQLMLPLGRTG